MAAMSNQKCALITGITGQDGSYLAELLLEKGYEVHGIKRRASSFNTKRIDHLYQDPHELGDEGQPPRLKLHYGDLSDGSNLQRIIEQVQPDEIYNLGAQSHVAVSFEAPEYTANVDALGTLRILEAVRICGLTKRPVSTRPRPPNSTAWCKRPSKRNHTLSSAKSLWSGEALCLLDHSQLSRGLWHVRMQRHSF